MVFQIRWTENYEHGYYTLFDIEVWQDVGKTSSYTEMKVHTFVEGISRYLIARKNDKTFNIEDFIKDANEVEDLRRWLWEIAFYKIKGHNAHQEKVKHIKDGLKSFCLKYDCYLNED